MISHLTALSWSKFTTNEMPWSQGYPICEYTCRCVDAVELCVLCNLSQ